MITKPIYTGIVNGKPVRFFKSPLNDGRPDFPWVCMADLFIAASIPDDMHQQFHRSTRQGHEELHKTIATADGLVTIAPHCVGLGFAEAAVEVGRVPSSFKAQYTIAAFEANKRLPELSIDGFVAAFHRHNGAITKTKGA